MELFYLPSSPSYPSHTRPYLWFLLTPDNTALFTLINSRRSLLCHSSVPPGSFFQSTHLGQIVPLAVLIFSGWQADFSPCSEEKTRTCHLSVSEIQASLLTAWAIISLSLTLPRIIRVCPFDSGRRLSTVGNILYQICCPVGQRPFSSFLSYDRSSELAIKLKPSTT